MLVSKIRRSVELEFVLRPVQKQANVSLIVRLTKAQRRTKGPSGHCSSIHEESFISHEGHEPVSEAAKKLRGKAQRAASAALLIPIIKINCSAQWCV